jgi:hypothetical protein
MKNEWEKLDPSIVAKMQSNKQEIAEADLWGGWAEPVEPREETEGNLVSAELRRLPAQEEDRPISDASQAAGHQG